MVDTTNEFGICVLQVLASRDENVAFSPYGLVSVALVLYEGARGPTAAEIHNTLRLPWDREVTRIGFRDMHRYLKSYFSNDGFLRGLVLSKPDVIIHNNYSDLLLFYGFDVKVGLTTSRPSIVTESPKNTSTISPVEQNSTSATNGTTTAVAQDLTTPMTTTTVISTVSTTTISEAETLSTTVETNPMTVLSETTPTTQVTEANVGMREMPEVMSQINQSFLTTMRSEMREIDMQITTELPTTVTESSETSSDTSTANVEVTEGPQKIKEEISTAQTVQTTESDAPETAISLFSTTNEPVTAEMNEVMTPVSTSADMTMAETSMTEISIVNPITPVITETSALQDESVSTITPELSSSTELTESHSSDEHEHHLDESEPEVATPTEPSSSSPFSEASSATTFAPSESTSTETQPLSTESFTATLEITTSQPSTESPSTAESSESSRKKRSSSYRDSSHLVAEHRDGISNWVPHYQDPRWNYNSQNELWFFMFQGGETVPVLTYTAYLPFAYISQLNALALQLPLDDPRYSIVILLPEERLGLSGLLYELQWCPVRAIMSHMKTTAVYAVVPSFTVVKHVNLGPALAQLGIRSLFDPFKSDLSNMSPEPHLFVRTIEQVVTVSLRKYYANHRWFDATPSDVQQHFIANHPFAYLVMDKETDVVLMVGTIVNPIAHKQASTQ
ncbi:serpin-Z1C-like isoform X2 [Cimex lectularius]|nr:serpin-Z1C-like isoform X2 [Cimex lectularius]